MSDLIDKSYARLVGYTANADNIAMKAASICYNSEPSKHIIEFCKKSGHESVLEHNAFTFEIQTSRIISQMFLRHRIASFSQRSQRYVVEDAFNSITPPEVENNPALLASWNAFQDDIQQFYNFLTKFNIPAEQARMALTNATTSVFYMTANAREWRHFLRVRTCYRAQEDIRVIAQSIERQLKEVAPLLFSDVTLPCLMQGFCGEGKMRCGKIKFPGTSKLMPTADEVRGIVELYLRKE